VKLTSCHQYCHYGSITVNPRARHQPGRAQHRPVSLGTARALETHTSGTLDVWTVPSSEQLLSFAPRANKSGDGCGRRHAADHSSRGERAAHRPLTASFRLPQRIGTLWG
jgi:hypothetical protein